ncbi:MAG: hypothetical protein FJW23_14805 [Acidimicrobiia bacterium]|nr:hypothetical protein [Acidimicrobiia bacterium]
MTGRLLVLSALVALSGSQPAPAQALPCITLTIELPGGTPVRNISTPEGRATAHIQQAYGDGWRDFYLDLLIRDSSSGVVQVSIHDERSRKRTLDTFELSVGGGSVQAATLPTFSLAVAEVVETTVLGCGLRNHPDLNPATAPD